MKRKNETAAARKRRIAQLKSFTKGDARINRKGTPKLPDLKEAIARALGSEDRNGKTGLDRIIDTMQRKASQGSERAADLLLDRGFGRAAQHVTTENINFNVTPTPEEVKAIKKALDKKI